MHICNRISFLLHSRHNYRHMNLSSIVPFITAYPAIPLSVALVIVLLYVIYLHRKLSIFMRGENAQSLEATVRTYLDHVDDLKKHDELIAEHALKLDKKLSHAIRNVSTMRFKAFEQNSSNQSFAIALVNELGNGVILSSLHHRDHVSVFAKPVAAYASTHDLTEEELEVLEEAKKAHKA
jgi:hypothetical protein